MMRMYTDDAPGLKVDPVTVCSDGVDVLYAIGDPNLLFMIATI